MNQTYSPKWWWKMVVDCMNYHSSFFHSRGRLLCKPPNPSQCEKWSGAKKKHVVACLRVHTNLWNLHQKHVLQIGRNWPSKKFIWLNPAYRNFRGLLLAVLFREGMLGVLEDGVPTKTLWIAGGWSKICIICICGGMDPVWSNYIQSECHHPTEATFSLMVGFRVSG